MKKLLKLAPLFLVLLFNACKQDDDNTPQEPNYEFDTLISATEVSKISTDLVDGLISAYNFTNPETQIVYKKDQLNEVIVYSVEYKSTYTNNEPIILSGLVCIPNNTSLQAPLISFQNGTIVQHGQAPTKRVDNLEMKTILAAAGLGFTMIIPDYIGFGSSEHKTHPYHHKKLFQSSITDLIIATKEMIDSGKYPFKSNNKLFLAGYSLGGWASLVTHKYIEDNPIAGLELIGSACGAGAYDLVGIRDYLADLSYFPEPFYVAYLINGYISAGDLENNLGLYFNASYASLIPNLFNGEETKAHINSMLNKDMTQLLTEEFRTTFYSQPEKWAPIHHVLENNSQKAWNNTKPIALYHGTIDENVPYFVSKELYDDFMALGVSQEMVKFTTLEGKDHFTGVQPMLADVLNSLIAK